MTHKGFLVILSEAKNLKNNTRSFGALRMTHKGSLVILSEAKNLKNNTDPSVPSG